MAAYGKRSGAWGWWLLLFVFGGIGLTIYTAFVLKPYENQLKGWLVVILCLPMAIALGVGIWSTRWLDRRRIREIGEVLREFELDFVEKVSPSLKAKIRLHIEDMDHRIGLPTGVDGVQWFAYTNEVLVFEHLYTTGSGKSTQEHYMTVVAWTAESTLPYASLGKMGEAALIHARGWSEKRRYLHNWGEEKLIDDPELDSRWLLYGVDASLQKLAFGGSREFLLQSPKGERWRFDAYWAVCAYPFPMDAKDVRELYDHVRRVLGG